MDNTNHPDREPSGSGQRFEVDLTRQCIRSGTVSVPGSMLEVFDAGPVTLRDVAKDRDHILTFTPPRSLSGLEAFIDSYGLQPNDKLILILHDEGGELHARKRPPRKRPRQLEEPPIVETDVPDAISVQDEPEAPAAAEDESGWLVREVRRAPTAGPPPSRQQDLNSGAEADEVPPGNNAPDPAAGPPPSPEEALERLKAHLASPDTPAIVRLEDVARILGLPEEVAWQGLDSLAREPESGVSAIRQDIYRISRQAKPRVG